MIKLKIITIMFSAILLAGFLGISGPASAQVNVDVRLSSPDLGVEYPGYSGLTNADPRIIVAKIIRVILSILGILLVALIIYGGFLWMTAAGNSEQVGKAKTIIISSVIGLVIILSAYALASFVMVKILGATTSGQSMIY